MKSSLLHLITLTLASILHTALSFSINGKTAFFFHLQGAEYRDLEYSGSYFSTEVNSWGTSFGTKVTYCYSTYLLGGYVAWQNGGHWVQRSYSSLPSHNLVYISFRLYRIDSIDWNDLFRVWVDSNYWDMTYMGSCCSNLCGNGWGDAWDLWVIIVVGHTSSSITITMYNYFDEDYWNESPAIRDFTIVFKNNTGSEGTALYTRSGNNPPTQGSYSSCGPTTYQSGGSCLSCHASCYLCYGNTNLNCWRCSDGYYYQSGACLPCSGTCRTCTGPSSVQCTSCWGTDYLHPDNSCRSGCGLVASGGPPYVCSCPGGTYFQTDSTCAGCAYTAVSIFGATCKFACNSGNYYYANGSCLSTCSSPGFSASSAYGNLYCNFACTSAQWYFANNTCLSTCPFPFTSVGISSLYYYCHFPCTASQYYYLNRTCSNNCPVPFTAVSISVSNLCHFPCGQDSYYFQNATCGASCPSPFIVFNITVSAYCYFPCTSSQFYFTNGTCGATCPSPYYSVSISVSNLCYFPCNQYQFYFANNTCLNSCPHPFRTINVGVGAFCVFPCQVSDFWYTNGSCLSTCTGTNFASANVVVGQYCFFNCKQNEFYYTNGSCLTSCNFPLIAQNISVGGYCYFPCLISEFRYINGSCLASCPSWPFTAISVSIGSYCNFYCSQSTYYYLNGSCLSTCPAPFTSVNISVSAYCNFPCLQDEYLYANGTCSTVCPLPFTATNISVGGFCNFICRNDFFYFQNGSCLPTCPYPFSSLNVSVGAYCNFPCARNEFWYMNGSCLPTCPSFPFTGRNISVGGMCSFFCAQSLYYFQNRTCLPDCPVPFTGSNISVGGFCDFPCAKNQYWYVNGTCSSKCPAVGFSAINISVGGYCFFRCAQNEYYYMNGSCLPTCLTPMIATNFSVGGTCLFQCASNRFLIFDGSCISACGNGLYPFLPSNISVGQYCGFACPVNQFFYANDTCLATCPSPFTSRNVTVGSFCQFPCTSGEYLFQNGSCKTTCPADYFTATSIVVSSFCTFNCPLDTFFYYNGSCLPTCPAPLISKNVSQGGVCTYPCSSSSQFYFPERGTCSYDCPNQFPFVSENISIGAYCYFPCPIDKYYYNDSSCQETCPEPFIATDAITGLYCDFPCPSDQFFLLSNQSCITNCSDPYTQKNISLGVYCYDPEPVYSTIPNTTFQYTLITTVAVTTPMILLGGDPYSAVMTVSALQSMNFALYYNVDFPELLNGVLVSAGNIGMMKFLPNPFKWVMNFSNETSPPPEKFAKGGYKTNFLENQGKQLLIISVIGGVYFLGLIVEKLFSAPSLGGASLPSMLIRLLMVFSLDIVISCWLQITNLSKETPADIAAGAAAFIMLGINVGLPVYAITSLSKDPQILKKTKTYEPFTEDFDMTVLMRKYFVVLVIGKRFIDATCLVLLYDHPMLQIIAPWATNGLMLIGIIKIMPHHNMALNFFESSRELAFFAMHFSVMTLAFNDRLGENESLKNHVGYTVFGSIGAVMGLSLINVWRENLLTAKALYTKLASKVGLNASKASNYKVNPQQSDYTHKSRPDRSKLNFNKNSKKVADINFFEIRQM